jgi:phosphoribosylanthranilate isomerase
MKFKVCGLTQLDQVQQLEKLGVDYAGFIFYQKSSRYVYDRMSCTEIKSISGNIKKVGVFVNATQEQILKTIYECGIELIQLHGDETPNFCEAISSHVKVIKAFRLGDEQNLMYRLKPFNDFCDMFLFDTAGAGYGGTGKKFNWDLLKDLNVNKPFFLSGGIQPGDEKDIEAFMQTPVAKDLYAVDVNSGFEVSPGVKNVEKVSAFIKTFRNEQDKP